MISDSERESCLDNYRRMSTVLVGEDEIWRPNKKKISHKYDVITFNTFRLLFPYRYYTF